MNKPVFYDPQRKRWKRLRRIFDVLALIGAFLGIIFIIGILQIRPLPELRLTSQTRNYKALASPPKPVATPGVKAAQSAHRKTSKKPSEVVLNSGEGLRAAYYVDWDPASYASLKQHIKQIDLLFPEWLHVISPDGTITSFTAEDNRPFAVVDKSGVHGVDQENKVARAIAANRVDTEVFPLVDNYDLIRNTYSDTVGPFLSSDTARANFIRQADRFLAANPGYHGLTLDFEDIPEADQPGFRSLIQALYADFHARNLRLYINTLVADPDFDMAFMAANSDGLLLMNYDEHQTATGPGPLASAGLVCRQPAADSEGGAEGKDHRGSGQLRVRLDDATSAACACASARQACKANRAREARAGQGSFGQHGFDAGGMAGRE